MNTENRELRKPYKYKLMRQVSPEEVMYCREKAIERTKQRMRMEIGAVIVEYMQFDDAPVEYIVRMVTVEDESEGAWQITMVAVVREVIRSGRENW